MGLKKENAYAILVGVGQRKGDHQGMQVTEQDPAELKKVLISRCGLDEQNITMLTGIDASVSALLDALEELATKTAELAAEFVMIYFSGHGVRVLDEGYLVLHDSINEDISSSGLRGHIFAEKLKNIAAKKMLLLLDCCHAGAVMPPLLPIGVEDIERPGSNRVIISACHQSQLSYLSTPVSLFSFAIIEGLSGKFFKPGDIEVTLFDLAMYVRERVVSLSLETQHPELEVIHCNTTENFVLASYPNGEPKPFFTEDFRMLDGDKNIISLNRLLARDEDYRKTFVIIQGQINIGTQKANTIEQYPSIDKADFNDTLRNFYKMPVRIENADDKKVVLNINGDTIHINNTLDEMKAAMDNVGVKEFQYAEKIYNIGYINQASFGMITGRKVFNLLLIKKLIDVIAPYNVEASDFRDNAVAQNPDWEKLGNFRSAALEYIHGSFPGIIRSQIRKLLAIGFEPMSENKQKKYISHSIEIVTTILRLCSFALIKGLLQAKMKNAITLNAAVQDLLHRFFSNAVEFSIADNFNLFVTLASIKNEYVKIIPELSTVDIKIMSQAITPLTDLCVKLDNDEYSPVECAAVEVLLGDFFCQFGFLSEYRMISIKGVIYEELHQQRKFFVHSYSMVEQHDMPIKDQISYEIDPIPTEAMILYKVDYRIGVNLFPFVIDLNAFTRESQSKICMYHKIGIGQVGSGYKLNYTFLEDTSVYQISSSGKEWSISNLNSEMGDLQNRKIAKLDMAYHQFMDAKATLTR